MKPQRDQLGPTQFRVLGRLVANMFEAGDEIEPVYGKRGGLQGCRLKRAGETVSATVVKGMKATGLLDDELRPTAAATNLYLRSLLEREPS